MCLLPDRIFSSIDELTPALLRQMGVRGLVLDVDNTLAPPRTALPDEPVIRWVRGMRAAGLRLFILSNNRRGRVTRFARALGVPSIHMGMKPFPFAFRRAVRQMGLAPRQIAAVGDQIYTDVFGAHLAGLRAFLVRPLSERESFFVDARRIFEKPILALYRRRGGK